MEAYAFFLDEKTAVFEEWGVGDAAGDWGFEAGEVKDVDGWREGFEVEDGEEEEKGEKGEKVGGRDGKEEVYGLSGLSEDGSKRKEDEEDEGVVVEEVDEEFFQV